MESDAIGADDSKAVVFSTLKPGRPAAPGITLVLLPSGPDTVRRIPPRRAELQRTANNGIRIRRILADAPP